MPTFNKFFFSVSFVLSSLFVVQTASAAVTVTSLGAGTFNWEKMTSTPNGDIYVTMYSGDIYKQIGGQGSFIPLGVSSLGLNTYSYKNITSSSNGDIYVALYPGNIYKQTKGTGSFVDIGAGSKNWTGITITPDGDIYAVATGDDIYKQTKGTGSFVALGVGDKSWQAVAFAPNGDIYAAEVYGRIWKQTKGTGSFVDANAGSKNWRSITSAPNGDIYATANGDDIYKQTKGTGSFVALGAGGRNWFGVTFAPNGDMYASAFNDGIYKITGIGPTTVTQSLTVARSGTGTGAITSTSETGINCGTTCSANFTTDSPVVLSATPSSDSSFTGWSGACTNTTRFCTVSMSAPTSVTATFSLTATSQSITTTSLPDATVGSVYTATLTSTGGTGTKVWSVPAAGATGALPAGLSIHSATGVITGTPTTAGSKTVIFTLVMNDVTVTKSLTLNVVSPTTAGSWTYTTACPTACGIAASTQTAVCTGGTCTTAAATRTCAATATCSATDMVKPVITILGSNPATSVVGATYTDAGATASDAVDGVKNVTVLSNTVNSSTIGTYKIIYRAVDVAGNVATSSRTVNIVASGINPGSEDTEETPDASSCLDLTYYMSTTRTRSSSVTSYTNAQSTDANTEGEVSLLQSFLKDNGYMNASTLTTGRFGSLTRSAVKSFQRANGIAQTGATGPLTRAKIHDESCAETDPIEEIASPTATFLINGVQNATVTVGQAHTKSWTSTGGSSWSTRYVFSQDSSSATTCTQKDSSGNFLSGSWNGVVGHTANGSVPNTPSADKVGCIATIVYTVTNSAGVSVSSTATQKTVAATINNFALTVARAGTGTGTVTSSPTGIDCGGTCSGNFTKDSTVTLTAAPATGSSFAGWTGACTNATGVCTVTMSAVKGVTATFTTSTGGQTRYAWSCLTSGGSVNITGIPACTSSNVGSHWTANNDCTCLLKTSPVPTCSSGSIPDAADQCPGSVQGTWTFPTPSCPSTCGLGASTQTATCVGGNGTCSGSAATRNCAATQSCVQLIHANDICSDGRTVAWHSAYGNHVVISPFPADPTCNDYSVGFKPSAPVASINKISGLLTDSFTMTWTAAANNPTSYILSVSGPNGFNRNDLPQGTSRTYTDSISRYGNLGAGLYTFTIRACNTNGCSAESNAVRYTAIAAATSQKPSAPSLSISRSSGLTTDNFTLSWGQSANNPTEYRMIITGAYDSGDRLTQEMRTSFTGNFAQFGLGAGTYYITIKACNANGCSENNNTVSYTATEPSTQQDAASWCKSIGWDYTIDNKINGYCGCNAGKAYQGGSNGRGGKCVAAVSSYGLGNDSLSLESNQNGVVLGDYLSNISCTNLPYNLHRGAESASVTTLQNFLTQTGLLEGGVTGFYGDKTVEAVKDYQASKGLPMTGMVYDFTRKAIQEESCR